MFFREKNGRNGRVIQLVESYRNEEGQPRQRVVASLGDELLGYHRQIEQALREGKQELFNLRRSIVLYDMTNTHFEGLCQGNPKAKHGKNKQKRNDCRQVAVGMAFDEHGFALAHEVFEGNIADTQTLEHFK